MGVGGGKFIQGTSEFKISVEHPYGDVQEAVSCTILMLRTKIWAGDLDLNVIVLQIIPEALV